MNNKIKKHIKDLENKLSFKEEDILLLFLAGSHMFSLTTNNSDIDIKGVIKTKENIFHKTNIKKNIKNNNDDIDLEILNKEDFYKNLEKSSVIPVEIFFYLKNNNNKFIKSNPIFKKELLTKYKNYKFSIQHFIEVALKNYNRLKLIKKKQIEFDKINLFINKLIKFNEFRFHDNINHVENFIKENNFSYLTLNKDKKNTYLEIRSLNKDSKKIGKINKIVLNRKVKPLLEDLKKEDLKYNNFREILTEDKILSTTLRLLYEAEELLKSNNLSFPNKNYKELLEIKLGNYNKEEIYNKIKIKIKLLEKEIINNKDNEMFYLNYSIN